jgi:CDP-diacylglycerol--glycerol-3-phosphate 3-phosphatidyltransferase
MAEPKRRSKRRQRPRSALAEELLNIPNLLTLARVAVIPVVMLLLSRSDPAEVGGLAARHATFWATLLFFLASVTDFLDGWLARRLNLQSAFGRFMDPLADKLLVTAILIELLALGRVPSWLVALLLSRELGITGLRSIAQEEGISLASDRYGKWKTALQMTGLAGLMLHFVTPTDFGIFAAPIDYHRVGFALILLSMVFSLWSAAGYMVTFVRGAFGRQRARGAGPDG